MTQQEGRIRRRKSSDRNRRKPRTHTARWNKMAAWWVTDCGVSLEDAQVAVTEAPEDCQACRTVREHRESLPVVTPCGAPRYKQDHRGKPCQRPVAGGGRCPYHREAVAA